MATPEWFSTSTFTGMSCPGTYPVTGNATVKVTGGDPQNKQQNVFDFSNIIGFCKKNFESLLSKTNFLFLF